MRAIQLLTSQSPPGSVIVVGLGGAAGSGKKELASRLGELVQLTRLCVNRYVSQTEAPVDGNFDDPGLTDFDLLLANVADLREGRPTLAPVYDFKARQRTGVEPVAMGACRVLLLEGIYALHGRVRPVLDLAVALDGGVHADLIKRVQRDVMRAGEEAPAVIQRISDTVFPNYVAFIEPDLKSAAIRIRNNYNPFSGFLTAATYTLKSTRPAPPAAALAALFEARGNGPCAEVQENTVDLYLMPPGEDQETCRDWIRMRLRGGRYTLQFEEYLSDGDLIIAPSVSFEVPVRVLSGLMSLGYSIGAIIKRSSRVFRGDRFAVKYDDIPQLGRSFLQIEGRDRGEVEAAGEALGLGGSYVPRSYIEQAPKPTLNPLKPSNPDL